MRGIRLWAVIGALLHCALGGCGDDDAGPVDAGEDVVGDAAADTAPPTTGAMAVFDPPAAGPMGFLAVPFPSDLMVGEDGTFEMDGAPANTRVWNIALDHFSALRGFCRSCAVSFGLDGRLDASSLPDDAPIGGAGAPSDAVLLMRVSGEGGLLPLDVEYAVPDGAMSIRAQNGLILAPGETYVAAITDAILAYDGSPLAPSPVFAAARDEESDGGGPVDRARAILDPGLAALADAGVPRERLVAATVFTTRDEGPELLALREIARSGGAPGLTVDRIYRASDGTLDEWLGEPSIDGPGRDVPAAAGTEGELAVAHGGMAMVVLGTFPSPRVVEGEGTEIGFLRRDASGALVAGPTPEAVPYLLVIPEGADLGSLPVAFAHTGNPGHRGYGLIVGAELAEAGIATLAIDPFQMGARAASATDVRNDLRGLDLPGGDGLAEYDEQDVFTRIQGLTGAAEGLELHIGYGDATTTQWIEDALSTFRLLQEGDLSGLVAAEPALDGLAFDPDALFFVGISAGTVVGAFALSVTDGVAAAVLSVPFASSIQLACDGPEFQSQLDLILPALGSRGSFDPVDRPGCMNPLLNFFRWPSWAISAEVVTHALLSRPLHGGEPPDLLVQVADRDATTGARSGDALVAQLGIPGVGDFSTAAVSLGAYPITANHPGPTGPITAGAVRFAEATHEMQINRWQESAWAAPIVPPFEMRDPPDLLDNPIDATHRQMVRFFETHMATGRATIEAP